MGGDDDGGKWFVAGGRSRAKKRQDANNRGGTKAANAGAGTSRGGTKKCFNCRGVGHLQHQCPSKAGASANRGKQAAGSHYGSSSNVSTAASTSSGGNRKPPPPKKYPKAGPSRGGGQPGGQAASTLGTATTGRKRARDTTTTSGFTPPNKQATGSTRYSYAAAEEGAERVVLVSLDGTALTKEDPRLLGEAVNKWTLDVLTKKEFHNVPEILDARPTKLGLEVKVRDHKSAHLVRMCAAKVNLRALTEDELEVMERPLRRYSGFMHGDANANLTKEAMQLMVDGQKHLRGIEGRMLVDRLIRTTKGCILWLCLDQEAEDSMARMDGTISLGFAGRVKFQAAGRGPGEKLEEQRERLQQEQRKLNDQQEALAEKLAIVNSQITTGIVSELAEGVGNSSIVPTAPASADTGAGNGNSEANSPSPAANSANAECAVERIEEECATPKPCN